ncbi:hypothetical protein HED34_03150 [Vagococcus fluvialis]|uniref:hypothetical protein n=1 Tax=Vagococcus fluvialis TaxID=2738 RepID=UPI001432BD02|nr:hypothetical protein [Vagococcus fluvialis]NKC58957.1 hypothetical protein [Vagococcus fluvialis]NKD49712.1 hypothetical protein [Vagococcus fluvialis]
MATIKGVLSVVMNSGVIYRVVFDDIKVAKERRTEWVSAEEAFDITYKDGSIITVNKKFVESINLTPPNTTHLSSSLDGLLNELYAEHSKQMRINNVGSKLQDIQYAIDRLPR